jgi:superfamily I DNA/RNA helicase
MSITSFVKGVGSLLVQNKGLEFGRGDLNMLVENRTKTIHSSKGLEAEVVVVLEANDGTIPMFHPDNNLYEMFGDNEEIVYHDQARLFYVAITRATKRLYVLYDGKKDAAFVKNMTEGNYGNRQ